MERWKAWKRSVAALAGWVAMGANGAGAQGFRYWDPADPAGAPRLISATGFYVDLAAGRQVTASAVPFEVNAPLWSDGAIKQRWVMVKPGSSIRFREMDDYWDYPDGTVFVKQFALDTVAGDPASRVLWETRFLMLKKEALDPSSPGRLTDRWYGYSYKWRRDQREADLVPDTGLKASLTWYPRGGNQPAVRKKWVFPARSSCLDCHRTEEGGSGHGRSVLGFFTAQLNRPSARDAGRNQLDDLFDRQVLSGARPPRWSASPRWHGLASTDPLATPERKARAYIAANCSGCHGARGIELGATSGVDFDYDYHTTAPRMRMEYHPVSSAYGLDNPPTEPADHPFRGVYLVTPGYPEKSVIRHRQRERNTAPAEAPGAFDPVRDQMPPLATFEADEAALAVIEAWIRGLPQTGASTVRRAAARPQPAPYVLGRSVKVPPGLAGPGEPVSLSGFDGRSRVLPPQGDGAYALPATLPPGLYILRVGNRSFRRLLP